MAGEDGEWLLVTPSRRARIPKRGQRKHREQAPHGAAARPTTASAAAPPASGPALARSARAPSTCRGTQAAPTTQPAARQAVQAPTRSTVVHQQPALQPFSVFADWPGPTPAEAYGPPPDATRTSAVLPMVDQARQAVAPLRRQATQAPTPSTVVNQQPGLQPFSVLADWTGPTPAEAYRRPPQATRTTAVLPMVDQLIVVGIHPAIARHLMRSANTVEEALERYFGDSI